MLRSRTLDQEMKFIAATAVSKAGGGTWVTSEPKARLRQGGAMSWELVVSGSHFVSASLIFECDVPHV